jgi:hypothetical protein
VKTEETISEKNEGTALIVKSLRNGTGEYTWVVSVGDENVDFE